jgi:hypothetical protein
MANFSLFETFFFITLAILFVLILLLVYHFKQRLVNLEEKTTTLFGLTKDIAAELTRREGDRGLNNPGHFMTPGSFTPYPLSNDIEDDEDEDEEDDNEEETIEENTENVK